MLERIASPQAHLAALLTAFAALGTGSARAQFDPTPPAPPAPYPGAPAPPAPYPGAPAPSAPAPYPGAPAPGTVPPVITGNGSPYDPNRIVGATPREFVGWAWDPYLGWVPRYSSTTVTESALSPWRDTIMPGTVPQNVDYWTTDPVTGQPVRHHGMRWLGQDGQWHGDLTETSRGPGGEIYNDKVQFYRYPGGPNESVPNRGTTGGPGYPPLPRSTYPLHQPGMPPPLVNHMRPPIPPAPRHWPAPLHP
jgi:hypothetical protein